MDSLEEREGLWLVSFLWQLVIIIPPKYNIDKNLALYYRFRVESNGEYWEMIVLACLIKGGIFPLSARTLSTQNEPFLLSSGIRSVLDLRAHLIRIEPARC